MKMKEKKTGLLGMSKAVLLLCIIIPATAIIAVTVFKVSWGSLFYIGAFLACPLIHIVMMKGGGHNHG